MEKWGDELEKWIYKDIQVEYECPKCGRRWTETHPLSESEYKQMIADYVTRISEFTSLKKSEAKEMNSNRVSTATANQESIGMKMKLQIPYSELETFVMKKYHQQVKLGYVDEKTISIKKKVMLKDVNVNISVDEVAGHDILLHYQACFSIEWMIKGALMWFKKTISGFVEEQKKDNGLLIHLDKIEQLSNVLGKIKIQTISFDEANANVGFKV